MPTERFPRLDSPKWARRRSSRPAWHGEFATLEARILLAPIGYSPAQIRHAYGYDKVVFDDGGVPVPGDGRGEAIALFEHGYAPALLPNLAVFDQAFGLPDPTPWDGASKQPTGPYIRVIGLDGTLPPVGGAQTEASLDVEWIHAVAPGANILIVDGAQDSDLPRADALAAQIPGVVVVSNSYSTFNYLESPQEVADNVVFTTPPGHPGVTFVDSSGDTGTPSHPPDFSPFVLSVGGTSLTLNADGGYGAETAWAGSGGGFSLYQKKPAYQAAALPPGVTRRAVPDVSILGNPVTGVAAYDPIAGGWHLGGGTSLAAPLWAAIIAIADQGRALRGLGSLDGATQTLPDLYHLPRHDFHDITVGNNGLPAGPGYDLVSGRGAPYVDRVVADLSAAKATYPSPPLLAILQPPASFYAGSSGLLRGTAGSPFNGTIATIRLTLPAAQAGDVIATVAWGDGSPLDTPPIALASIGRGAFQVRTVPGGTRKTFDSPGLFRIVANLTFPSGIHRTIRRNILISPALLTAAGAPIESTACAIFSGPVATFADPGRTSAQAAALPALTYSARISWGDGTSSPGIILPQASPTYLVLGSHEYPHPGFHRMTVRIFNVGNGRRWITSAATRSPAIVAPAGRP